MPVKSSSGSKARAAKPTTRTRPQSRPRAATKPSAGHNHRNSSDSSKISVEAKLTIKGEGCGARELLDGLKDAFGGCRDKDQDHKDCDGGRDKKKSGECNKKDQEKKSGGCQGGKKSKKSGGNCGGKQDPAKKLEESLKKCRSARGPKEKEAAKSELGQDYENCKSSKVQLDLKLELEVVLTLADGGSGGGCQQGRNGPPRPGQRVA